MKKLLIVAFSILAHTALAQNVTNHAVPIGRGPGVVGWGIVGPCAAGFGIVGTGVTTDPSCQSIAGLVPATPPAGAVGDVQYNNGGIFGGYTDTQLTTHIDAFTSTLSGAAPASGGGTTNFLRADGTWTTPPLTTPSGSSGQVQYNNSSVFGGTNLWVTDANTIEKYNSTTAQAFNVYNTRTDGSNYERGVFDWTASANTLTIGAEKAGSGTVRSISVIGASTTFSMASVNISNNSSVGAILTIAGFAGNSWQLGIGTNTGVGSIGANNPAINLNASSSPLYLANNNTATMSLDPNNKLIQFGTAFGSMDAGIARSAAGVLEVNNGTAGTLADILVRAARHNGTTITNLPGTPVAGMVAYITDGDAGLAWGATAVNTGAGATKYLVWYNGTNWTVVGK